MHQLQNFQDLPLPEMQLGRGGGLVGGGGGGTHIMLHLRREWCEYMLRCNARPGLQAARSITAADLPPPPSQKSRRRRWGRGWAGFILAALAAAALAQPYVRVSADCSHSHPHPETHSQRHLLCLVHFNRGSFATIQWKGFMRSIWGGLCLSHTTAFLTIVIQTRRLSWGCYSPPPDPAHIQRMQEG